MSAQDDTKEYGLPVSDDPGPAGRASLRNVFTGARLFVALMMAGVIGLSGLQIRDAFEDLDAHTDMIRSQAYAQADAAAREADSNLKLADASLMALSHRLQRLLPLRSVAGTGDLMWELEDPVLFNPGLRALAIYDIQGQRWGQFPASYSLPEDCADCGILQSLFGADAGAGMGYVATADGIDAGLAVARTVFDDARSPAAALVGILDNRHLEKLFGELSASETESIVLYEGDGRLIAEWRATVLGQTAKRLTGTLQLHPQFAHIADIATASGGVRELFRDNRFYVFHQLPSHPAWVGVITDTAAFELAWLKNLYWELILNFLVVCIMGAITWVAVRQHQQRQKAEAMLRLAHRDLEQRVEDRTADLRREINDRLRIEAELRSSEMRFQQFMTHTPAIAFIKDSQGRYLYANAGFATLVQVPMPMILGAQDIDLFDKAAAGEMVRRDAEVLMTGITLTREIAISTDQDHRTLLLQLFVIKSERNDPLIAGVAIDVTEFEALKEELGHARKLETLGQLTGGVAHDFNNLLTIILGNLEMLEALFADEQEALELLADARQAGQRAGYVTDRLLSLSRKQPMTPRAVDLGDLEQFCCQLLQRTIGEDIALHFETESVPIRVWTDPVELENAVLNLALNARDAMPSGGSLTITISTETLQSRDFDGLTVASNDAQAGIYGVVSIRDSGSGMSKDVLDHAFDAFFTTKGADKGTGLGLSMVRGFILSSGGGLRLESVSGSGTTVTLYLPQAPEAADQPFASGPFVLVPQFSEGLRVLLVEDEPEVRRVAARALDASGFQVTEVRSIRDAMASVAADGLPDLLLSDVVLPDGGGLDLAERLRRERKDLSVVLMSGYLAKESDVDRIAGHFRFLRKPFSRASLLSAVAEELET